MRREIVLIAQGLRKATLDTAQEAAELANAINNGNDPEHPTLYNSIGGGTSWIPHGRLLLFDEENKAYIHEYVY